VSTLEHHRVRLLKLLPVSSIHAKPAAPVALADGHRFVPIISRLQRTAVQFRKGLPTVPA